MPYRSHLMIRRVTVALLVLGVAVVLFFIVPRERSSVQMPENISQDHAPVETSVMGERTAKSAVSTTATADTEPLDFEAMSDTFRNTTFLIAIRRAGFMCEDVVASYHDGGNAWTANCPDTRAYAINVEESDELAVKPIVKYFDVPDLARPVPDDAFLLDREPSL